MAHPRSRGENASRSLWTTAPGGSSPLTRGKPVRADTRRAPTVAHPRSRGENMSYAKASISGMGSSPLTRGKPRRRTRTLAPCGAHPRSRGENADSMAEKLGLSGSSPLTRGKPSPGIRRGVRAGLIPAHAGKTAYTVEYRISAAAHPRSRGENLNLGVEGVKIGGSSPLTRGKRLELPPLTHNRGLIPAHAGKTVPAGHAVQTTEAHPRSRGENARSPIHDYTKEGSSPLTRGKPVVRACFGALIGLIPAHAGKTPTNAGQRGENRAHPRSRGENSMLGTSLLGTWGSSPLTRGKRSVGGFTWANRRLIPAHAGKTSATVKPLEASRAHPRSRGENVVAASSWGGRQGSSPLTRGKRGPRRDGDGRGRLIPAHAGKTRRWRPATRPTRAHPRSRGENPDRLQRREKGTVAHPRSRGENQAHAVTLDRVTGSSPLTRGKQLRGRRRKGRHRLIPAHAGKTKNHCDPGPSLGAHPRSRGENRHCPVSSSTCPGSSPLTRGKPTRGVPIMRIHGLIPAHAGKTLPDLRFYRADRSDLGKP